MRTTTLASLITSTALLAAWPAQAALDIQINYTGDNQYLPAFTAAAATWESLLIGYQNGLVVDRTAGSSYSIGQTVSTVFINASVTAIDGAGGTLGQAGPTELVQDGANFILSTDGVMEFDSADITSLVSGGQFGLVIQHEMAHVLGFGTIWGANGVRVNGSGEFTGANATAMWQSEFGQTGTPNVELGGGPGTADGHWNEVDNGAGLTGIVDAQGRDMRDELMTGWLNPNAFISRMTVASFVDIGFVAAPVPEPATYALFGLGALVVAARTRRRG